MTTSNAVAPQQSGVVARPPEGTDMTPREIIDAVRAVADSGGYSDVAISWVAVDECGDLERVDTQPDLGFMVVDNYYCSVVFTTNNGVITPVYANGEIVSGHDAASAA